MAELSITSDLPYADLFPRGQQHTDVEFDITAMIDVVSLMNIYFLVTFAVAIAAEINLPAAAHAVPLDGDKATTITVLAGPDWKTVAVYLGDGKKGSALMEPDDQVTQIANAVERAAAQGKTDVLIKAEKGIRLREMKRIATAASREGIKLHIAIMEKETAP
jgi:biopolymer transport protein ExbD